MSFDISMETTNHLMEIKLEWKIRNFSKFTDKIAGPAFYPISKYPFRWQFLLKFEIDEENDDGTDEEEYECYFLALNLNSLNNKRTSPLKVSGKISLKNSSGLLWKQHYFDVVVKAGASVECWMLNNLDYKLPSKILSLFALGDDDVFVVECSMTVSGIITSISTPASAAPALMKEDEDLCKAFKLMYKKNAFTDVTFQIGKQIITSHKAVLSVRSSVFEKMFDQDTLENQTSSIEIKDFDYRIFDCFIGYLYTKEIRCEVKEDITSLLVLYEVADKYEVVDLQRYCADILLSCFLNVSTVSRIVETADMHNDKYLMEPVMEFIRHRFSEVAQTSEWARLIKSNIELASDILSYVTTVIEKKQ